MEIDPKNIGDRMSELPEGIIHTIMSNLYAKQAAQTSILSKAWLKASFTNPTLAFNQQDFHIVRCSDANDIVRFYSFVEQTLTRYQEHSIAIEKLSLRANLMPASLVENLLQIASQNKVHMLSISLPPDSERFWPQNAFAFPKSLVELDICHCNLTKYSNFFSLDIKLDTLRKLNLRHVHLDERMIQKLMSIFPLITLFSLYSCDGFRDIKVANTGCLKYLEIIGTNYMVQSVVIESHKLESLIFSSHPRERTFTLQISATHNLKRIHLCRSNVITDEFVHGLIGQCPVLEDLRLQWCDLLKHIDLASTSLKIISIKFCWHILEININTPNLVYFEYIHNKRPDLLFITPPSKLQKARIKASPSDIKDLVRLRGLLENFIVGSIYLSITLARTNSASSSTVSHLQGIFPPPLKYVGVLKLSSQFGITFAYCDIALKCLFWTVHPKYVRVASCDDEVLAEFLYLKLIVDTQNVSGSDSHEGEHWLPTLKDAVIVDADWTPIDCPSLEDALEIFEEKRCLHFRLNWW